MLDWTESGGPQVSAPLTAGFGTALIERTLQTHDGEATLRYSVTGVTCKLRLPLGETARPEVEAALAALGESAHAQVPGQTDGRVFEGRRILIVEDEPLLAMELETNLNALGCKTLRAAATLNAAKAAIGDSECDAALVDVNLAGGDRPMSWQSRSQERTSRSHSSPVMDAKVCRPASRKPPY